MEFGDRRVPLLSLQTCAYTLHTTEQLLRHTNRPLLAELGSRGDICLTQLTHLCATMLPGVTELGTAQESCVRLLRLVLDQPADGPPVTEMDAFGLVVMLSSLTTVLFAEQAEDIPAPAGSIQVWWGGGRCLEGLLWVRSRCAGCGWVCLRLNLKRLHVCSDWRRFWVG